MRFERRIMSSMVSEADPQQRAAITTYVDGALRALPEHIRVGVAAESVLLRGWAAGRRIVTRRKESGDELLDRLERSPIGLVRQYPRLLRSLVLFAEQESVPEAVS